jgi:hypothetical protein
VVIKKISFENNVTSMNLIINVSSGDNVNLIRQHFCLKNGAFWGVTPCASCKNGRFVGTWRLHNQGDKNRWTRNVAITSNRRTQLFLQELHGVTSQKAPFLRVTAGRNLKSYNISLCFKTILFKRKGTAYLLAELIIDPFSVNGILSLVVCIGYHFLALSSKFFLQCKRDLMCHFVGILIISCSKSPRIYCHRIFG